ncbi:MAG: TVP38/TMEM64 family protein [Pirellulaceae bacterium]|nr:TVP38/TMEM64 family protein [Pirellulaceae bacterium]
MSNAAPDGSPPGSRQPKSSSPDGFATDAKRRSPWRWLLRGVLLLGLVAAGLYVFVTFRQEFALERLAEREQQFRLAVDQHPLPTYGGALVLYVAVTALALPFAAVMSLVYGWLFGFWPALILISFASTAGATCSFLLSRYIFGAALQERFGDRLRTFNESLDREGPIYLFTLRLIPLVPFFVINVVMGLTRIRTRTFWWISQIGMLPGTIVYVFAGSSIRSLEELSRQGAQSLITPRLMLAFVLLGLFPLAARWTLTAWKRSRGGRTESHAGRGNDGEASRKND